MMMEFFTQGDRERARDLPVSMFMDRYNTNVPGCQVHRDMRYLPRDSASQFAKFFIEKKEQRAAKILAAKKVLSSSLLTEKFKMSSYRKEFPNSVEAERAGPTRSSFSQKIKRSSLIKGL